MVDLGCKVIIEAHLTLLDVTKQATKIMEETELSRVSVEAYESGMVQSFPLL